jgi:hypothetical protein
MSQEGLIDKKDDIPSYKKPLSEDEVSIIAVSCI